MIRKIYNKLKRVMKISIIKFVYYNFFCKSVKRDKNCWLIPYRNSIIDIDSTATINLHANYMMNAHKIKRSRAESILLLRKNAILNVTGKVNLYYNTTVQVHNDGILNLGNVGMNSGGVLICAKKITIRDGVSMGRGVYIFDSDHHPIYNVDKKIINQAKDILIEENVWLGLKSTILKGSVIKKGSVIGAHSLIGMEIPEHIMVGAAMARPVMRDISWHR